MGRIFDAVLEHLEDRHLKYDKLEGRTSLQMRFRGPGGGLHCKLDVNENPGVVQFWVRIPMFAPAERRHAVAEFVARANFGLSLGNFEFDFRDGEIRYKTCAWPGRGPFEPSQAGPLIDAALGTTEKYLPALTKVIFTNVTAEEAIAEIEDSGIDPDVTEEISRMLTDDDTAPPTLRKSDERMSHDDPEDAEEGDDTTESSA